MDFGPSVDMHSCNFTVHLLEVLELSRCYQDAMAIVAKYGKCDDLFRTYTCNPKTEEITEKW